MANEFLLFATGDDPNILPQADYEALPARDTGFESGKAVSEQLNKVWRQGAFVASSIAQFIADTLGVDVLDDGDRPSFVASFIAAVRASTSKVRTVTAAGVETLTATDRTVVIKLAVNAAKTVEMPADPPEDWECAVIDGKGIAGAYNISLDGNGHQINGLDIWPMNQDRQSTVVVWDAETEEFYIKANYP